MNILIKFKNLKKLVKNMINYMMNIKIYEK